MVSTQRARARHRHRRARRLGDGRLSGHDRVHLAARRTRGPAQQPVGRGHGRQQRAIGSVRRAQPVVLLRRLAGARADRSRQPAHPRRSHQVRRVRAAFTPSEAFGRHDAQEILGVLAEQGLVHRAGDDAPWTWTNESYPADAVSLRSVSSDNFVIADITHETRVIGETDFTSGPSTLHPKAIYIIEGQLYQVERLDFEGRKAFVREIDCDYYTTAITYTKVTPIDTLRDRHGRWSASLSPRRVSGQGGERSHARRSPRRLARRRLQENQVLYEREHRIGRSGSAGTADAHDVVLADGPGRCDGAAAVCLRRSPRRRGRPRVRAEAGRAAAADVRRPRHRHLDRYWKRRRSRGARRDILSRSSSTTTIPAASVSAHRCSRCIASC